jgi:hypothetical protein
MSLEHRTPEEKRRDQIGVLMNMVVSLHEMKYAKPAKARLNDFSAAIHNMLDSGRKYSVIYYYLLDCMNKNYLPTPEDLTNRVGY